MFNIPAWGMIQLCTGAKGKDVITSSAHWVSVFAKRSKQVTKDLAAHHWPTKQSHCSNRILSFGFGACSPVVTVSYRSMKKGAPGCSVQLYWVLFPPAMLSRGFFLLRERYTKFFVQNLGIPQFSSEREIQMCAFAALLCSWDSHHICWIYGPKLALSSSNPSCAHKYLDNSHCFRGRLACVAPLTLPTLPGRWLQRKQLIYTVHWNDRSGFSIAKMMRDLWIQGPVALFSPIGSGI